MMATAEHLCFILLLCVCVCTCLSDYYSLLGVSRSASSRDIKKAFHRLALKHHPDKNQSPNAQQVFTHIAQAYEVLSDREKRRVYDQMDYLTKPDQAREGKFKKDEKEDMDSHPFVKKETFHSKRGFQHFGLEELLHSLRMDDDFFMGEQPGYEGWSFIFGAEDDDDDETVLLSDLFNML
ncbi:dnaJ homolog subfamily B member 9 [Carassius auratus]|uniref:DnaJ homolog subfamily B member 9 n=1 Tax=Carassius auratus TaxID=7957 RepID=A0A6P6P5Z6_CARAU|nr:dnaJ homolog subfamily B member 9-like [Carassius auratus]XP_052414768.1 dnaJ homolog subfamily B member 9 [Carassius gibelio]